MRRRGESLSRPAQKKSGAKAMRRAGRKDTTRQDYHMRRLGESIRCPTKLRLVTVPVQPAATTSAYAATTP
jgi:hypothetical protein